MMRVNFLLNIMGMMLNNPICDALQRNREKITQTYFEVWAIEVGIGLKNDSSVEIFVFLHTLICLLSPPRNF